jgi:hypothetical protein
MKIKVWAWAIGGAAFAAIVALWFWQLPSILNYANGGKTVSFGSFASFLGAAKGSLAPQLADLQEELDANLSKISRTLSATAAQAQALDEMKKKIEIDAAKKKIEAAIVESQNAADDVPAGLPSAGPSAGTPSQKTVIKKK